MNWRCLIGQLYLKVNTRWLIVFYAMDILYRLIFCRTHSPSEIRRTMCVAYYFALRQIQNISIDSLNMVGRKNTKRDSKGECVISIFGSIVDGVVDVKVYPCT